MTRIIFILLFSFLTNIVSAQDFSIPSDWKFDTKEDLEKYRPDIEKAIDWALNTPLYEDTEKRKEVNAFVLAWLMKTPDVSIEIDENASVFFMVNPEVLMPFTMGWTKYSLNNNSKDFFQGFKAGTETAVLFYRNNIAFLKKDKAIEDYEKRIQKGELDKYLNKVLKNRK